MPDRDRFLSRLGQLQRRIRISAVAWAFTIGGIAASATAVALGVTTLDASNIRWASAGLGMATCAMLTMTWWKSWNASRVARAIEARTANLDNLIVTAEEVIRGEGHGQRSPLRQVLYQQAAGRLDWVSPDRLQPLATAIASAATVILIAAGVFVSVPGRSAATQAIALNREAAPRLVLLPSDLRVLVTPPAYTGRQQSDLLNPTELAVLEGTAVRLETARAGGDMQVVASGGAPVAFAPANDRWVHEFVATDSSVLLVRRNRSTEGTESDRLLQVRVEPDRRPLIRIVTPAKDLVFGEPNAKVPIAMEARDDIALETLVLRYTKVSGSGETFSFEEGQLPIQVRQASPGEWRAEAQISLDALKLVDGDTLVYRALATDRKPGADPSTSDTFLIEIGRLAGVASTGFAVDEERDRQGLSQQMLIIKTERLHAARSSMTEEAFQEQARLLAVEQRMVKAEFVFMTGGEVADEVQEAEHAHELAEGRFENAGQVELLTAIREMSRAEARLNAADTGQGLSFERAALRALQRAFDRRRYLLRTLPERARIDLERRLTGDVSSVRPSPRLDAAPTADETLVRLRRVMAALELAIDRRENLGPSLASDALTLDPSSKVLQEASIALASGAALDDRVDGARAAHRALTELLRQRLGAAPRLEILNQPVLGRFAEELRRTRQ